MGAAKASTYNALTDNPTVVTCAWGLFYLTLWFCHIEQQRIDALRMLWTTSPSLAYRPVISSILRR
ncbi:hypothetical protein E4Z61_23195 [Citrobacter tructae]|uniref:Uncharacterized protein n=1 Tax=Citrobacter tructae TaxID=2562449 RepID=A0ABX5T9G5_9ENTR|nr:hypothetical protein E4Z61_23195 [Citrobacter tructae]